MGAFRGALPHFLVVVHVLERESSFFRYLHPKTSFKMFTPPNQNCDLLLSCCLRFFLTSNAKMLDDHYLMAIMSLAATGEI